MRIIALAAALALAATPALADTIGRISLKIGLQTIVFDVSDEAGQATYTAEEAATFTGHTPDGASLTLAFDGSAMGQVTAELTWVEADGETWVSDGRPMDVAVTRHIPDGETLLLEGRLRGALANGTRAVPVDGLFAVELSPAK